MHMTLGIDVACRAAHQASLADESGRFAWSGRRFRTTSDDLQQLWDSVPPGAVVTVVMEPTRNAWVPLAAWFRRHGATVVMVPPEQSADLRDYYSKHVKTDRLDSRLLARLPLLHPDGLRPAEGLGPADPLRRAVALRGSLVKRRSVIVARLDSYLELPGPDWHAAFGGDLTLLHAAAVPGRRIRRPARRPPARENQAHPVHLAVLPRRLGRGARQPDPGRRGRDPAAMGHRAQLPRPGRGHRRRSPAWPWHSAPRSATWTPRSPRCCRQLDPASIMTSVPGVGTVNAAQILARLGDPSRFRSLAGARSFTGLVPALTASGTSGRHGPPTKAGDASLREALFLAADHARRADPTLAARYYRLMVHQGKHHNSALCHIAPTLLTRIIACWRAGHPLPDPRHRRHPAHRRPGPRRHRRTLPRLRRAARPPPDQPHQDGDEPATPGVARRSDTSPPPHHATTTSPTT